MIINCIKWLRKCAKKQVFHIGKNVGKNLEKVGKRLFGNSALDSFIIEVKYENDKYLHKIV